MVVCCCLFSVHQEEERRQRALQPFLVPAPKWGIIGNSKYAERLRRAVVMAARDPLGAPVMVFGEPGLEKDNIAALIHFGSARRVKPMVQVGDIHRWQVLYLELRSSKRCCCMRFLLVRTWTFIFYIQDKPADRITSAFAAQTGFCSSQHGI